MAEKLKPYDVVIVGAGIAGCALAHGLATVASGSRSKPLRIALVERSFAEPDRIVGELLQPGGVEALRKLGMEDCLEGIGAVPVYGYCVVHDGKKVHIPYPEGKEGRSFHHGRFIQALRAKALKDPGVEGVEASVSQLVKCEASGRVIGVRATRRGADEKEVILGDLVLVADGCFSSFRAEVLGEAYRKPLVRSYFVGAILNDARLPIDKHGTVALVKGSGPVLLYQIDEHDTRILVDVREPLPSDLKTHILENIMPDLPESLHLPIQQAIEKDRLRRMPNSFMPPVKQGVEQTKEGAVLVGDSWNMRHPLTGGGMTVALHDAVILTDLLRSVESLDEWEYISHVLHEWHWRRKPLGSTINILSIALYDLFGAEDEELAVLRTGCFKYFERGGRCIQDPVALLSGLAPSRFLLFLHFFAVAFYSIWVMFMHPRRVSPDPDSLFEEDGEKPRFKFERPSVLEWPLLFVKSFRVFWTACIVFGPPLWSELK